MKLALLLLLLAVGALLSAIREYTQCMEDHAADALDETDTWIDSTAKPAIPSSNTHQSIPNPMGIKPLLRCRSPPK